MGTSSDRRALGALLEPRASAILDAIGVEAEAVSTTHGPLGPMRTEIGRAAASQVPLALAALIADDPEREARLVELAAVVARTDMHRVPVIARLGLARLGLRLARGVVRAEATRAGHDADALVAEFARFEEDLVRTVFAAGAGRTG